MARAKLAFRVKLGDLCTVGVLCLPWCSTAMKGSKWAILKSGGNVGSFMFGVYPKIRILRLQKPGPWKT